MQTHDFDDAKRQQTALCCAMLCCVVLCCAVLCVPFRNAIFTGIIATERYCFAQLLNVVLLSVLDRYFFAPLRKAIRYSVNVA